MNSENRPSRYVIPKDVEACMKCLKTRWLPKPVRMQICRTLSKHQGKSMSSDQIAIALRDAIHEAATRRYLCFRLMLYRTRRMWIEALVSDAKVVEEILWHFDQLMSWHRPKQKRIPR